MRNPEVVRHSNVTVALFSGGQVGVNKVWGWGGGGPEDVWRRESEALVNAPSRQKKKKQRERRRSAKQTARFPRRQREAGRRRVKSPRCLPSRRAGGFRHPSAALSFSRPTPPTPPPLFVKGTISPPPTPPAPPAPLGGRHAALPLAPSGRRRSVEA